MDILSGIFGTITGGIGSIIGGAEWWQIALLALDYAMKIAALGWVPASRRPSSAMAWLLAIFLLPFVGLLLFFLMGSPYINRRRHNIQNKANELIRTMSEDEPDTPEGKELSEELHSMVKLNRTLTSLPAVGGTMKRLLPDYQESLQRMAEAIDEADVFVSLEFYITAYDQSTAPLFEAMERAVQRGVKVRVLWDHIGAHKYPGNKKLGKRLDAMGVEHHLMLPLQPWRWRFRRPDLRNHRKLLVIDGHTAFMGSQNMIEPWYQSKKNHTIDRQWVDVMVEVTGPIVSSIHSVFAVDWYTECGETLDFMKPGELGSWLNDHDMESGMDDVMQLIPSGPGYTTEPNLRLFTSIAHHAKERLKICSPYFVPDESLIDAVTTACYRGVEVELYVSEKCDQALVGHAQASYYKEMLQAGVKMYLYPEPYVLHSKFMIADGEIAVMGSSNMDMRSFSLNYEMSLLVGEGQLLESLRDLTAEYRRVSSTLPLEEWESRPWYQRYVENVARLTSALQ